MAAGRSDDFDEFRGDDCLDDEELIELSPGVKGKAVKRLRDNVVLYHVVSGNRGRPKKVFIFPPRPKTALQAEERRTIVRVFSNLNKLGEEDALKKTALLLDVGERSVSECISEFYQEEGNPGKRRRGNFTNHRTAVSSSKELRDCVYSLIIQRAAKGENTSAKT